MICRTQYKYIIMFHILRDVTTFSIGWNITNYDEVK